MKYIIHQSLSISRRSVRGVVGASAAAIMTLSPLAFTGQASAANGAIWPTSGVVTGVYGNRCPNLDNHKGIDIANNAGTDIKAVQGGTISTGYDAGGWGNYLLVDHGNGWKSRYAHLSSYIRTSGTVVQGEHIGEMGTTGGSNGNHLHLEMIKNGVPQNYNSSTSCGATITSGNTINFNFAGLTGSTGASVESVANGGGTRITGANSYMDISSQGHVYHWNGPWHGGNPSNYGARIVDAKTTPNNAGYWMVGSNGNIYAYGNAQWYGGSPSNYGNEIVAMASTSSGNGYVLVSDTGNVYAYGGAQWHGGSPGNYSGKFVDIEMTPDGGGYWLLTSAGQIYAYGNAQWYGNATNFQRAIVAMSRTSNGQGYVLVSKTGQVYSFGNAQHFGNATNVPGEVSDISYRPDGQNGYLIVNIYGQHYSFNTPWIGNPSLNGAIF